MQARCALPSMIQRSFARVGASGGNIKLAIFISPRRCFSRGTPGGCARAAAASGAPRAPAVPSPRTSDRRKRLGGPQFETDVLKLFHENCPRNLSIFFRICETMAILGSIFLKLRLNFYKIMINFDEISQNSSSLDILENCDEFYNR